MSKICQVSVNNKLGHFEQLITAFEIIKKICNGEIDETDKKVIETQSNHGNDNSKHITDVLIYQFFIKDRLSYSKQLTIKIKIK